MDEGELPEVDMRVEDNSTVNVDNQNKTMGTFNYACFNSPNLLIVYFLLSIDEIF